MTPNEVMGAVGGIGAIGTLGGGLFWLGKLHGRVSELTQENAEMKTRLNEMEKKQTDQEVVLGRIDENIKTIKSGHGILFKKMDIVVEALIKSGHSQEIPPANGG